MRITMFACFSSNHSLSSSPRLLLRADCLQINTTDVAVVISVLVPAKQVLHSSLRSYVVFFSIDGNSVIVPSIRARTPPSKSVYTICDHFTMSFDAMEPVLKQHLLII